MGSCCYLKYPKYLCDLPTVPYAVQRQLGCIPNSILFQNDIGVFNSYFACNSNFPYRVTIVNSNGRVIYDNRVPSQYWCLMGNVTESLEFQIALLGNDCRAVVRTEYPDCPYGISGPGCYPVPNIVTGITGTTGSSCNGCTGGQGCVGCIPNTFGTIAPYTCIGFSGASGCTGSTYLFSAQIRTCGGLARWLRIGQPLPNFSNLTPCIGCQYAVENV